MGESAGPELPLVADLVYTPALVRQAYTRAWRQTVGGYYLVALLVVAVTLGWHLSQRRAGWFGGALGCALLMGAVFPVFLWRTMQRRGRAAFDALGDPPVATLAADEGGFKVASAHGEMRFPWDRVTQLWRYPEHWTIGLGDAGSVTIPLASVSEAMQAFVLDQVRAYGGKLV